MTQASQNSALIVVDLLEDYFDEQLWPSSQIPSQRELLVDATNNLVSAFRRSGLPVIWIRQEFKRDLSDAYPHMVQRGKSYTIENTPGAQLLHELQADSADPVFIKKRFSAFFGTDLNSLLARLSINTLYLVGITSAWCLRSTATDAYQLGYEVFLVDDAISGFTHSSHNHSMAEMDGYVATRISLANAIATVQTFTASELRQS